MKGVKTRKMALKRKLATYLKNKSFQIKVKKNNLKEIN